jgi:hypothetical protein
MTKDASKKSKETDDFKSKFRKSKDEASKKSKKKVSKKNSKKTSKPIKKLEPYCGIKDPLPKNKRLGTMDECYTAGEVRYYGLNKIDSKVIKSKKKKDINAILEEDYTMLLLKAKKNLIQVKALKKKLEDIKDQDEIKKTNLKIDNLKEENKIIKEKLEKLKKN